jgi:integrase
VQAAKDGDHSDGGGLLLRVRGESAAWVFRYTAPSGRRREMGLGVAHRGSTAQAGDTLTAARDKAHDARQLLRDGTDPLDAKEQRREALREAEAATKAQKARERWTLARCARDYHERTIEPTKTAKHAAQWIASLENHVPASVWHKPIADIEPPELLEAFSQVKPHERARRHKGDTMPETLQRMRQRLDAVFEDAIFHRRCTSNPAAAIRRKMRETLPRKLAGQFAALPYREAPALLARVRAVEGIAARCLEFAVLTAARTGEVLGATWAEIDLQAGVWVVPAERMKAKEPHTVYLSPRALEVLAAVRGLHKAWVFPSPMLNGKPMSNMAMLKTLERLGVRDQTTVHGLCQIGRAHV